MATGPSQTELRAQLGATIKALQALAEIIRELGEVPSGELFARLMGKMTLETYNRLIGTLKEAGLVTETPGHLLRWVGPKDLNNTKHEGEANHG